MRGEGQRRSATDRLRSSVGPSTGTGSEAGVKISMSGSLFGVDNVVPGGRATCLRRMFSVRLWRYRHDPRPALCRVFETALGRGAEEQLDLE